MLVTLSGERSSVTMALPGMRCFALSDFQVISM